MSHENGTTAGLNYKAVAYWLVGACVALLIYIFLNTVAAQEVIDARQDNDIVDLKATTQELTRSNALLTQIVMEDRTKFSGTGTATPKSLR